MGGADELFDSLPREFNAASILNATAASIQLFLIQLALGIFGMVSVDNDRLGRVTQCEIYSVWDRVRNSIRSHVSMTPRTPRNPHRQSRHSETGRPSTQGRLGNISRFLTRVMRKGQKPEDSPLRGMSSKQEGIRARDNRTTGHARSDLQRRRSARTGKWRLR